MRVLSMRLAPARRLRSERERASKDARFATGYRA